MLAYLIFLGLPLLGALLLGAEHVRRNGETPRARRAGTVAVAMLGGVFGVLGCSLTLGIVWNLLSGPGAGGFVADWLLMVPLLLSAGLLLFSARNALRVVRSRTSDDSIVAIVNRSRESDALRLSGWLLVLLPATLSAYTVLLGVFGVLVLIPALIYGIAAWTTRRARTSQFLWTLALAVEHGFPLADEVEAFWQTLWGRPRRKLREVANRLHEGRSLLDALELGGVLPNPLVGELRAAQAAGTLPQALRRAAAASTSSLLSNRIDGSIAVAAVYVWSVCAVVILIVGFVMYYIIPKFKEIFADFDVELPWWTIQAITLSDAFASHSALLPALFGLPVLAGLIAVVVGIVGWGSLNYPLLMRWFPRWDAPGLLNSLAYIVEAERPLPEALEEMAEHQRRRDLRERLLRMQQLVDHGRPVWTVLESEGFVRPAESQALEAASRTGNLNWALRTLAESMRRTARYRLQLWIEFIKPGAVIALGCVVGFFVIAFFLPLVKLIGELT